MKQRDNWHLTETLKYDHGRGDPFAAAVRATRMPMVITDPTGDDNPIVFCNEAFQRLTGYDRDEITGRNCRFLQGSDTNRDDVQRIRDAIENGQDIDIDLLNYRKDGSTFWNALYLSPVRNDAGEIQFYFASQLDVTDRVDAQRAITAQKQVVDREVSDRTAQLSAALEAKSLLLHEVDHRVKNNLTMIGSLLRLQARTIDDSRISARLETMLERVDALATVHRRLYQSDDVTRFDVAAFVENLVSDVVGASGRTDIEVYIDAKPLEVSSSQAAAAGLIINEVVTNAIKHGFDDRAGRLTVEARQIAGSASISIADDGPGLPEHLPGNDGLGRKLVNRLLRQIDGHATWSDAAPGTKVLLTFPIVRS